ncbi:hypothetical protein HX37_17540 [Salmonella enterica]|uniref:Uncharacterized protein n=1 Tax=Salmonella enterica TaxID=28901 RepID=A0A5U2F276_SALER|nr:hypothetical protein [Salmonella enterica]HAK1938661.1 hypothetical protein [Salmonella enterica]
MKILNINAFERLASQRLVTISEVVNALYGLNPNVKTKDLDPDITEEVQDIRKTITRNIRYLKIHVSSVNDELDSDLVFAAAHDYMMQGITPEVIIERGKNAIVTFFYANDWQKYMMAFGGRSLVDEVAQIRKTGRGQHRKTDEETGTLKMMGLLIKLLAEKHPSKKYGSPDKPTITEIYKDVVSMIERESLTTKGVGKSTFAAKASQALRAVIDDS